MSTLLSLARRKFIGHWADACSNRSIVGSFRLAHYHSGSIIEGLTTRNPKANKLNHLERTLANPTELQLPYVLYQLQLDSRVSDIIPHINTYVSLINSSSREWTAKELSGSIAACCQLLSIQPEPAGSLVAPLLRKLEASSSRFTADQLVKIFSIFVHCDVLGNDFQRLALLINVKLGTCSTRFRTTQLAHMLYSMRNIRDDKDLPVIKEILKKYPQLQRDSFTVTKRQIPDGDKRVVGWDISDEFSIHSLAKAFVGLRSLGMIGDSTLVPVFETLLDKLACVTGPISMSHISSIMHSLEATRCLANQKITTRLLDLIQDKLHNHCVDFERPPAAELSTCIQSLRWVGDKSPSAIALLQLLQSKLVASVGGFRPSQLAACMLGTMHFHDQSKEVVDSVLGTIGTLIDQVSEPFSPSEVSTCIHSLKFRKARSNVLKILKSMTPILREASKCGIRTNGDSSYSSNCFSVRSLGNMCSGVRQFDSHSVEVRQFLSALVGPLQTFRQRLNSRPPLDRGMITDDELSLLFSVLQNKSAHHEEVIAIVDELSSICALLAESTFSISPQNTALCLWSLKDCKFHLCGARIKPILSLLARELVKNADKLKAENVVMCMHSFQNRSNSEVEAIKMIGTLSNRVNWNALELNPSQLMGCFQGLRTMNSDSIEVRQLLCQLHQKYEAQSRLQLLEISQLAVCAGSLRSMSVACDELSGLLSSFARDLESYKEDILSHDLVNLLLCVRNLRPNEGSSKDNDVLSEYLAVLQSKLCQYPEQLPLGCVVQAAQVISNKNVSGSKAAQQILRHLTQQLVAFVEVNGAASISKAEYNRLLASASRVDRDSEVGKLFLRAVLAIHESQ